MFPVFGVNYAQGEKGHEYTQNIYWEIAKTEREVKTGIKVKKEWLWLEWEDLNTMEYEQEPKASPRFQNGKKATTDSQQGKE